jgi:hypothetical protein
MRRRTFVAALGSAAVARPFAAVEPIEVAGPDDCERAFSASPGASVDGLLVSDPPEFVIGAGPDAIAAAAQRHGPPAAGAISIAKSDGLLGYGVDVFVDNILKGAKTFRTA